MRFSNVFTFAIFASLPSAILGQNIINDLSFGQTNRQNLDSIPGWNVRGSDNSKPRILSDRIVLTPPAPGNKRGALWGQSAVSTKEWTAELEFRVSGPEHAGGNLQLWYVKDKLPVNELASVYTVGKFEGMVIVLDQYRNTAGTIRGFLNDGSTDYKSRQDLEKLAFAHCPYSYRNLGRMSKMKITHSAAGIELTIDDKPCFKSDKVQLPPNYYFGISAASAENPDSVEVSKLTVVNIAGQQQPPPQQQQQQQQPPQQQYTPPSMQSPQQPMGQPPQGGSITPPQAEDLRSIFTALQGLQATVQDLNNRINSQSNDIKQISMKSPAPGAGGATQGLSADQINAMARRLEEMEKNIDKVKNLVEDKEFIDHLQEMHDKMEDLQHHISTALPNTNELLKMFKSSSPRLGFFIFIILAFQGMLAVSYVIYKRRRANSPKKLL